MVDQSPRTEPGFATLAIHAGAFPDSSNRRGWVLAEEPGPGDEADGFAGIEDCIAALEAGTAAVVTASGLAAQLMVLHALLGPGDEVVLSSAALGASEARIAAAAEQFGWSLVRVDDGDPVSFASALSNRTAMILVESLSTRGQVTDIAGVAEVAGTAGVPLVVDNTLASPYLIRPIDLGADVVLHAGAAILSGVATCSAGVVVDGGTFDWASSGKLAEPRGAYGGQSLGQRFGNFALATALRESSLRDLSARPSATEALMLQNGLETLALRVQRQSDSALAVAHHLANHAACGGVFYAGLKARSHGAMTSRSWSRNSGPILTVRLGAAADHARFIEALQLFTPGGLAGGSRSTIVGAGDPGDDVGLSIGLEDVRDLIADLDHALSVAVPPG